MINQNVCFAKRHLPRVFLSLLFIVGALGFLANFDMTVGYITLGLTPWGLASIATIATVVAIVFKLGGGLMLLFNYKPSVAAWMLIAFTVVATLLYHMDWSGAQGSMQMTQFLKNLAIVGGLLLYADCLCKTCQTEKAQEVV